jgi:magnesium transporter
MSDEIGIMPEEAVFIGERKVEHLTIEIIEYGKNGEMREFAVEDIREILPLKEDFVTWINIVGIHDDEHIKEIGALFEIHPLTVEDILNTEQFPKFEDYDDYLFFITKLLDLDGENIIGEQVSLIMGKNYVISFQEIKTGIFEPIRRRIRRKKGRIFRSGADYLAYILLDAVVENYILITEKISSWIEDIEDKITDGGSGQDIINKIGELKRELNYLRRIIRPTHDLILQTIALETDLIDETTEPFFKDLLDISLRVNSEIELCREMLSDNLQIYNLDVANRFNLTVRVLTVFTALFAPLTFIVGIYGMNFTNMPEIENFEHGYFVVWTVMITIVAVMLLYFKKKRWF